jgi:UDP-N-acetylglucosamine transferase subunit ALG13
VKQVSARRRIFVTVGAQTPFDRLVRAVDAWAGEQPDVVGLAQIGDGEYVPRHLAWERMLSPSDLEAALDEADTVVAHAGTGSLLAALERQKPIVLLPRRAALKETRNDHQLATARRFQELAGVAIAWHEDELGARLSELGRPPILLPRDGGGRLARSIATFIDRGPRSR